jgi:hypothetical protein
LWVWRAGELGRAQPKEEAVPDIDDSANEAREMAEDASPDVANDPGSDSGGDLNQAGSEPAGRGE